MYAAVTTGISTLKGPLHGGANEESMHVLQEIGDPTHVDDWVKERLARKEKIMGFGHRVYKTGDSRVPVMRELGHRLEARGDGPRWIPICEKLEEVMQREKKLCSNVDLYAAVVLRLLRIPAALNPSVFALSRVSGWCAHVIEQQDHNRLIRPRSLYSGVPRRSLPHAAELAGVG
jgi:citrate synthase